MEHIELLAPAAVRDLALKLRNNDWVTVFEAGNFDGGTKEGRNQADQLRMEWHEDNPVSNYVPKSYRLIEDVAIQIRTFE